MVRGYRVNQNKAYHVVSHIISGDWSRVSQFLGPSSSQGCYRIQVAMKPAKDDLPTKTLPRCLFSWISRSKAMAHTHSSLKMELCRLPNERSPKSTTIGGF
ncbi:hypothetical protein YC2023_107217 [Brassica napus]